jgi:hypothetical protein
VIFACFNDESEKALKDALAKSNSNWGTNALIRVSLRILSRVANAAEYR